MMGPMAMSWLEVWGITFQSEMIVAILNKVSERDMLIIDDVATSILLDYGSLPSRSWAVNDMRQMLNERRAAVFSRLPSPPDSDGNSSESDDAADADYKPPGVAKSSRRFPRSRSHSPNFPRDDAKR